MDIALFVNNIWPVKKQWRPLNQNQLKQYLNLLENGISVAIRQWQNFWWEQRNVLSKKYAMQMEHVRICYKDFSNKTKRDRAKERCEIKPWHKREYHKAEWDIHRQVGTSLHTV